MTMGPTQAQGPIPGLNDFVKGLDQVNVAIPLIAQTVINIAGLWTKATGQPVDLSALADQIAAVLSANRTFGQDEVARLRAELRVA